MSALNVSIYNREGKKVGEQKLAPEVFGVKVKPEVVHEAVLAQLSNSRHTVAHTKTRGEVRGGGKKPWKQKGTGRARAGSTRSPIWVGGGVTFGPRPERNFEIKLNRKVRNLAIRMSLSDKVTDGKLIVLDELALPEYKTKVVAALLKALPINAKKTLLILSARDEKVIMSGRNIPGVKTVNAASLSVVEVIDAGLLLTTAAGVGKIEQILTPKK